MIRNPTPERIAILTTITLGVIFSSFLFFFKIPILSFLISVFTFCSLTFIIIVFGLEVFIYRKIKLIYKTIHKFKTTKFKSENFTVDLDKDPIKKVNEEVIQWAYDQKQEITQLKAMENYRKDFLGNVSHELKTPIFNIQGYVETLIEGAINDPQVNMSFLHKTANSIERLNNLVNDLLEISKLESGTLKINFSSFDICSLYKDVFDAYNIQAHKKNTRLKIKEGCDKPFMVLADKEKIRQVLNNLIGNAIAYGNENGLVSIGFYDMDKNILIEVADNGDGIDEEHLPRLFERFYRIDKSRARNSGGSGLGLSIVKHIIEAHHQIINVRSSLGEGTTFGFTLKKG
ncbi:MAG: sensor histidine kinase [Bacteroidetes bacterium]|nr:sensor histidine kinase [Bacteroidota bacterium]